MYFYQCTCAQVEIKGNTDTEIGGSCLYCGISTVTPRFWFCAVLLLYLMYIHQAGHAVSALRAAGVCTFPCCAVPGRRSLPLHPASPPSGSAYKKPAAGGRTLSTSVGQSDGRTDGLRRHLLSSLTANSGRLKQRESSALVGHFCFGLFH